MKYERLDHYPELDRFPRGEALARLNDYEREERAACQPWLRSFHVLMALGLVALVAACFFAGDMAQIGLSLFQVPILIVQFVLYRRLRRRVRARMTMEFGAAAWGPVSNAVMTSAARPEIAAPNVAHRLRFRSEHPSCLRN
jgi:hypothetical protein